MKCFLCSITFFIIGFVVGTAITSDNYTGNNNFRYLRGIELIDAKQDCLIRSNLKVIQGLEGGRALATPINSYEPTVLIIDENHVFYDDEIVRNPSGKCAKQIGVYRYETIKNIQKAVPAVVITDI